MYPEPQLATQLPDWQMLLHSPGQVFPSWLRVQAEVSVWVELAPLQVPPPQVYAVQVRVREPVLLQTLA